MIRIKELGRDDRNDESGEEESIRNCGVLVSGTKIHLIMEVRRYNKVRRVSVTELALD